MGKNKTVLIVYAHHHDKSLNAAILDVTVNTLKAEGCDVILSDLHKQKFNPVVGYQDVKGQDITEDYGYLKEVATAYSNGKLKEDIVEEQAKLSKADLVIFQFPMMWFSIPAILKGWLDRVLAPGYAYDPDTLSLYDKACLKGKKAILSFTTGGVAPIYTSEGLNGDMQVILYPIHRGALQFCGFDVLGPNIVYGTGFLPKEAIEASLNAWRDRIPKLWREESIPSLSLQHFDFSKGGILNEDSEHRDSRSAPSVGCHCGKPICKI